MGMFGAKSGSIAGFQPTGPSTLDKIGLIGDIWAGNSITRDRLNQDFAFQQAQYQAMHPAPIKVGEGDTYIDPLTGKTLFSAPTAPTGFAAELAAAGYAPGSADFLRLARQKAEADAAGTPFVYDQYNPATGGTDKVISTRGAITGGAQAGPPQAAIDYLRKNPGMAPQFEAKYGAGSAARVLGTGGAAPATGPGGFPLYPVGH